MSSPPTKKKRSFNRPHHSHKKQYLEVGQRGFLATCNFREKDCVRECYNLLNEYANELYGPAQTTTVGATEPDEAAADNSADIVDDLQKEIAAAATAKQKGKDAPRPRFQVADTGIANCVFIRTTLEDPVELGERIIGDIAQTRKQKTRHLLRLVPIASVCRANVADIVAAGGPLFDKYFLKQGSSFAIVFNKRYNNSVSRDDVIQKLAELVQSKNVDNRVDLKNASKVIIVEVMKGLCGLTVVQGYFQHKKFNLVELANVKEEDQKDVEKKTEENKLPKVAEEASDEPQKNDAASDEASENDVTTKGSQENDETNGEPAQNDEEIKEPLLVDDNEKEKNSV